MVRHNIRRRNMRHVIELRLVCGCLVHVDIAQTKYVDSFSTPSPVSRCAPSKKILLAHLPIFDACHCFGVPVGAAVPTVEAVVRALQLQLLPCSG